MTVPVRTARSSVSLEPTSPRSARTGAAKRAYDKRRQRAKTHEVDAATSRVNTAVAGRIPFVAVIIGLLAVGLASALLLSTRAAEESYQLSAERAVNQRLIEQGAALERDVETANSAPELARQARDLGMIPSGPVPRLLVLPDGVVQVVGTPAPASGPPAPDFDTRMPASNSAAVPRPAGAGAVASEALTPVSRPGDAESDDDADAPAPAPEPAAAEPEAPEPAAPAPEAAAPAPEPAAPAPEPAAPAPSSVGEQQVPVTGGVR